MKTAFTEKLLPRRPPGAGPLRRLAVLLLLLLTARLGAAQGPLSKVWVPDLGNGQYKNPVLYADYSDPDVIRVGADFYLTASSFNAAPGLPILHSRDLVNWTIIGAALPEQPPLARYRTPQHGNGVWAPAIRYHRGEFYIYYPDPDLGIFVIKARNPAGPWSAPVRVKEAQGWIDPCPLWDEDGKAYLVHGFAGSRAGIKSVLAVSPLSADGLRLTGPDALVFDGHAHHPTVEGPKLYKRHGYYYIFAPAGGVSTGWQLVLRAKNVYGPYEERIVLDQGSTRINGPHQGAWVDTDAGEDWFLHFQDQGPYGRVVHLQPMTWKNDWPVIGADPDGDGDGKGQPVLTYRKPRIKGPAQPRATPATSDEFSGPSLGRQWQWHANPQDYWAYPNAPAGYLRLYAVQLPEGYHNLWQLPNLFLQKLPAEIFTVTTKLTFTSRVEGEKVGLVMMGLDYAYLSLTNRGGRLELSQAVCAKAEQLGPETTTAAVPGPAAGQPVYLRVAVRAGARCQFSYSLNGQQYQPLGAEFQAVEGKWIGAKVGLFCTRPTRFNDAGSADVDWFRIE